MLRVRVEVHSKGDIKVGLMTKELFLLLKDLDGKEMHSAGSPLGYQVYYMEIDDEVESSG